MKKVIKIIKNNIFGIIIGVVISTITIVLADTIAARLVTYDNSISGSYKTNVQDAIDNLYNISSYLYENVPNNGGATLTIKGVPGLSECLPAGNAECLKRYQGTTANNYICFGTTNKSTCTSDTDKYMYRIIGIDNSNQMKLIKKEALNTGYAWSYDVTWPSTSLYIGLNGSYFLTNSTYVPSGWEDRIATANWHYFVRHNIDQDAAGMAKIELENASISAKIGLLHIHDYYYGLPGGNNCYSNGGTCKTSWINLFQTQNDGNPPHTSYEWTMSRSSSGGRPWALTSGGGVSKETEGCWYCGGGGDCCYESYMKTYSVRPVFYLTSSQVIASGSGTLADPYILQ